MFTLSHSFRILPASPPFGLDRAGALFRAGRLDETEAACRAVLDADPGDFDATHLLGVLRMRRKRWAEAAAILARAAGLRTGVAQLHVNLGNALMALGRNAEAAEQLRAAVAIAPGSAEALAGLGLALLRCFQDEAAIAACRAALAAGAAGAQIRTTLATALAAVGRTREALDALRGLAPEWGGDGEAEALIRFGAGLLTANRVEEALDAFDRAAARDPALVAARSNRWLALLLTERFAEGWAAYERRWDDPDFATAEEVARLRPRWTGAEELRGRRILLKSEQGLGDTLQFVRYAPLVAARGGRVVLCVQKGLGALLRDLPGMEAVIEDGDPLPDHDLACPLMSLPLAFGTRADTIPADIPYVVARPDRIAAWTRRLGPRGAPRVGLAWSGNPENPNDYARSIPLERLDPLLRAPGFEFHAVQKDVREPDGQWLARTGRLRLHADALTDFAETAALLALMDLVVTADTSVAHLAGAMGRPTWLLVPFAPDFRWLRDRADCPWYPSFRLFRQDRRGDWDSVVARVAAELRRAEFQPVGVLKSLGRNPPCSQAMSE